MKLKIGVIIKFGIKMLTSTFDSNLPFSISARKHKINEVSKFCINEIWICNINWYKCFFFYIEFLNFIIPQVLNSNYFNIIFQEYSSTNTRIIFDQSKKEPYHFHSGFRQIHKRLRNDWRLEMLVLPVIK